MNGLLHIEQLINLVSKRTLHNDPYDCIKCQSGIACMAANFFEKNILITKQNLSKKVVLVVMSDVEAILSTLLHDSFKDIWSQDPINVVIYIGDNDKEFKNSEKEKKVNGIKAQLGTKECFATVLPKLKKWKNNNKKYYKDDIVRLGEKKYQCLEDHTSINQYSPKKEGDKWREIKFIYDIFEGNNPEFFFNERQNVFSQSSDQNLKKKKKLF
eukprot:g9804.t1